jgi:hypothetical protein
MIVLIFQTVTLGRRRLRPYSNASSIKNLLLVPKKPAVSS